MRLLLQGGRPFATWQKGERSNIHKQLTFTLHRGKAHLSIHKSFPEVQDRTELNAALNDRACSAGNVQGTGTHLGYATLVLPVCQAVKQLQSSSSTGLPLRGLPRPTPRPKAGGSQHLEEAGVDFIPQQRAVPHKFTMKDQQGSSIFYCHMLSVLLNNDYLVSQK